MSPDELQKWIQILGNTPGLILVGYFLWRELRAMNEKLLGELQALRVIVERALLKSS
jgi:hypothetical protein